MYKLALALFLSTLHSLAFADYCFTDVENLDSCDEEALIATNTHLGSYKKFVNNKTFIQTVVLNPKPLDLRFFKPGSPAYDKALENMKNFVPTQTHTVKFKLNGNNFEKQFGSNSSCYLQGTYRESKDTIEFDGKKIIGSCSDIEKSVGKIYLKKITYRKINY